MWLSKDVRMLDVREKLLYVYLLTNAHFREIGVYFLPTNYISYDLNWSPEDVDASLSILCSLDLIEYSADGIVLIKKLWEQALISNENLLNAILPFKGYEMYDRLYQCIEKPVSEPVRKTKKTKTVVTNTEGYSEDFERFWEAYPRKDFKVSSFTAYNKALKENKDMGAEQFLICAQNYNKDCIEKRTETKFIKKAKNFFVDGFFRDFLPQENVVKPIEDTGMFGEMF